MPVQILNNPSIGERFGKRFGEGLSSGLQKLAERKISDLQKSRDMEQTAQGLQVADQGIDEQQAYGLAALGQQDRKTMLDQRGAQAKEQRLQQAEAQKSQQQQESRFKTSKNVLGLDDETARTVSQLPNEDFRQFAKQFYERRKAAKFYENKGYSKEDAEMMADEAMGDPKEVLRKTQDASYAREMSERTGYSLPLNLRKDQTDKLVDHISAVERREGENLKATTKERQKNASDTARFANAHGNLWQRTNNIISAINGFLEELANNQFEGKSSIGNIFGGRGEDFMRRFRSIIEFEDKAVKDGILDPEDTIGMSLSEFNNIFTGSQSSKSFAENLKTLKDKAENLNKKSGAIVSIYKNGRDKFRNGRYSREQLSGSGADAAFGESYPDVNEDQSTEQNVQNLTQEGNYIDSNPPSNDVQEVQRNIANSQGNYSDGRVLYSEKSPVVNQKTGQNIEINNPFAKMSSDKIADMTDNQVSEESSKILDNISKKNGEFTVQSAALPRGRNQIITEAAILQEAIKRGKISQEKLNTIPREQENYNYTNNVSLETTKKIGLKDSYGKEFSDAELKSFLESPTNNVDLTDPFGVQVIMGKAYAIQNQQQGASEADIAMAGDPEDGDTGIGAAAATIGAGVGEGVARGAGQAVDLPGQVIGGASNIALGTDLDLRATRALSYGLGQGLWWLGMADEDFMNMNYEQMIQHGTNNVLEYAGLDPNDTRDSRMFKSAEFFGRHTASTIGFNTIAGRLASGYSLATGKAPGVISKSLQSAAGQSTGKYIKSAAGMTATVDGIKSFVGSNQQDSERYAAILGTAYGLGSHVYAARKVNNGARNWMNSSGAFGESAEEYIKTDGAKARNFFNNSKGIPASVRKNMNAIGNTMAERARDGYGYSMTRKELFDLATKTIQDTGGRVPPELKNFIKVNLGDAALAAYENHAGNIQSMGFFQNLQQVTPKMSDAIRDKTGSIPNFLIGGGNSARNLLRLSSGLGSIQDYQIAFNASPEMQKRLLDFNRNLVSSAGSYLSSYIINQGEVLDKELNKNLAKQEHRAKKQPKKLLYDYLSSPSINDTPFYGDV